MAGGLGRTKSKLSLIHIYKEHKRAQMGSGLGLSIVKNILDMHGGTYGVTSTLGQGSTFWFELPVAQQSPESLPGPQD